jgi:integrase
MAKKRKVRPVRTRQEFDDDDVKALTLPRGKTRHAFPDPEQRGHYIRLTLGSKAFYAIGRDPWGKQVWTFIAATDDMPIAESRLRCVEINKRLKAGKPAVEPPPPPPPEPETFKAVAQAWFKAEVKGVWRTADKAEWRLERYVYPQFGTQLFTSLKRSEIAVWRRGTASAHGKRTAELAHGQIRQICDWYAEDHDDYVSPIQKVKKKRRVLDNDDEDVVDDNGSRARVLDDDELRAVWRVCEEDGGRWASLIQFTLMSGGQRLDKYLRMLWSDITPDQTWVVTRKRRAKGVGGKLKLPPQALEILRRQPRLANDEHVFPSNRYGGLLSASRGMEQLRRKLPAMPAWSHHDVRRTWRTLAERAKVDEKVSERTLGHKLVGIKGIYNRYHYEPEKADALQRVADLVTQIVASAPQPSNVLHLQPAQASG